MNCRCVSLRSSEGTLHYHKGVLSILAFVHESFPTVSEVACLLCRYGFPVRSENVCLIYYYCRCLDETDVCNLTLALERCGYLKLDPFDISGNLQH